MLSSLWARWQNLTARCSTLSRPSKVCPSIAAGSSENRHSRSPLCRGLARLLAQPRAEAALCAGLRQSLHCVQVYGRRAVAPLNTGAARRPVSPPSASLACIALAQKVIAGVACPSLKTLSRNLKLSLRFDGCNATRVNGDLGVHPRRG